MSGQLANGRELAIVPLPADFAIVAYGYDG